PPFPPILAQNSTPKTLATSEFPSHPLPKTEPEPNGSDRYSRPSFGVGQSDLSSANTSPDFRLPSSPIPAVGGFASFASNAPSRFLLRPLTKKGTFFVPPPSADTPRTTITNTNTGNFDPSSATERLASLVKDAEDEYERCIQTPTRTSTSTTTPPWPANVEFGNKIGSGSATSPTLLNVEEKCSPGKSGVDSLGLCASPDEEGEEVAQGNSAVAKRVLTSTSEKSFGCVEACELEKDEELEEDEPSTSVKEEEEEESDDSSEQQLDDTSNEELNFRRPHKGPEIYDGLSKVGPFKFGSPLHCCKYHDGPSPTPTSDEAEAAREGDAQFWLEYEMTAENALRRFGPEKKDPAVESGDESDEGGAFAPDSEDVEEQNVGYGTGEDLIPLEEKTITSHRKSVGEKDFHNSRDRLGSSNSDDSGSTLPFEELSIPHLSSTSSTCRQEMDKLKRKIERQKEFDASQTAALRQLEAQQAAASLRLRTSLPVPPRNAEVRDAGVIGVEAEVEDAGEAGATPASGEDVPEILVPDEFIKSVPLIISQK
ncbi:hypothetical protein P7C70_g9348, partial [Phenoliferia sp. Uapishka_3]